MIRANRIIGLREFVKAIILDLLKELGIVPSAKSAKTEAPKAAPKKPAAKKAVSKAKKVASVLLIFCLASAVITGSVDAKLRPKGVDKTTTKTWEVKNVKVDSVVLDINASFALQTGAIKFDGTNLKFSADGVTWSNVTLVAVTPTPAPTPSP